MPIPVAAGGAVTDGSHDFYHVTYHVGADYAFTRQNLLYVTLSTGFRSGGFNTDVALNLPQSFDPETVLAYEIGSKNRSNVGWRTREHAPHGDLLPRSD